MKLIPFLMLFSSLAIAADAKEAKKEAPQAPQPPTLEEAFNILDAASTEYRGTLTDHQKIRQASQVLRDGCIKPKDKK